MSGDGASVEEVKAAFIQVVPIIIQHDPRKLYEYFDAQGVKICIGIHPDSEEVFIYYNSVQKHSYPANSRAEAEKASFLEAFKIVEERINTDQNQVYQ